MKYMIFCRGINSDCTASLKKYSEIYLLIKYIKSVLWRVAERLSYIEDAWCLKVRERRGYSHLKEEALDRTMWRARFGRGFGPVVRQTAK